jgi:hypothetical protein
LFKRLDDTADEFIKEGGFAEPEDQDQYHLVEQGKLLH